MKTKKIIGLGESIHGSRSIIQKKKEITEKLCEDKNIKLICFEAGIDMVMNWDLYIQGILPESYRQKIEDEVTGGFLSFYAHLSKTFVNVGDLVNIAEQIACVGNTRISTGNHLHYEIRKGNRYLNFQEWCYCLFKVFNKKS